MSEGPLISCSWFHDAFFIFLKASPEGYLFQASGITKGRKITSWSMWRRGKSKYFKGPFIKMLRRNTPYGNIIYMLIQLKVTRKWPEDLLSYRFILTKQIYEKGTTDSMQDTRKGYLLSKIVYVRVRDWTLGETSPNKALLSSLPPHPPPPFSLGLSHKLTSNFLTTSSISSNFFRFKQLFA